MTPGYIGDFLRGYQEDWDRMSEEHKVLENTLPLSAADEAAIQAGESVRERQAPPPFLAPEPPPVGDPDEVKPDGFRRYRFTGRAHAAKVVSVEGNKVAVDLWPEADAGKPDKFVTMPDGHGAEAGDWLVHFGGPIMVFKADHFEGAFDPI